jgi:hypothetical protein
VALCLIFGAVAEECHATRCSELLDEPQRELLAVVLNGSAALVDRAIKEQLLSILL